MKLKFNLEQILKYATLTSFCLLIFTIPTFNTLNTKIVWGATILFLLLASIYLLFFGKVFLDFFVISIITFCFIALISSALNRFSGFVLTPFYCSLFTIISYLFFKANKPFVSLIPYILVCSIFVFEIIYVIESVPLMMHGLSRIETKFGDLNDIGIIVSLCGVCSFYSFFKTKKIILKIAFILVLFLSFTCCLITGSKTALFSIFLMIIAILFMRFPLKKWYVPCLISVVLIALFFAIMQIPLLSSVKFRIESMLATFFGKADYSTYDASTAGRFYMFVDGMSLFLRKPLFGFGVHGFFVFSSYGSGWSHNNFSELLCSYGLIGTVAWFSPLILFVRRFLKSHDKQAFGFTLSILMFFFIIMFSAALGEEKIFMFIIGTIFAQIDSDYIMIWKGFYENSRNNTVISK